MKGPRKQQQKSAHAIRYCSDRCRNRKPGPTDKRIEAAIVALLNAEEGSGIEKTVAKSKLTKGDRRITVTCDEIEEVVFGSRHDPNKKFGRKKNRASRALGDNGQWKSVDMASDHDTSSDQDASPVEVGQQPGRPLVRPSQLESDVNGSIGGEKGWAERQIETPEELEKRLEGQQRAEEREMIRRAARRGVVFGFVMDASNQDHQKHTGKPSGKARGNTEANSLEPDTRRKCEALVCLLPSSSFVIVLEL